MHLYLCTADMLAGLPLPLSETLQFKCDEEDQEIFSPHNIPDKCFGYPLYGYYMSSVDSFPTLLREHG